MQFMWLCVFFKISLRNPSHYLLYKQKRNADSTSSLPRTHFHSYGTDMDALNELYVKAYLNPPLGSQMTAAIHENREPQPFITTTWTNKNPLCYERHNYGMEGVLINVL